MTRAGRKARELAMTGPPLSVGGVRPRLRLMKTVEGRDASTYLVPVPELAPPGLHFSAHPSGEFHLKSPLGETRARADFGRLRQSTEDGTIDRVIAELLVRPKRWRFNDGLILSKDWLLSLGKGAWSTDLDLDQFLGSLKVVELGDSRHLASHLTRLRQHELLRPLDTLLLPDPRDDAELYFLNVLGEESVGIPPLTVTRDLPFWRSMSLAFSRVREFGGVFFLFPEGARLRRIADRVGVGGILRVFSALDRHLEGTGANPKLQERIEMIEKTFVPSLKSLKLGPPIRLAALPRRPSPR